MQRNRRIVRRASTWLAALALCAASPLSLANDALLAAAMRGDLAQVRTLAENHVDLNYSDNAGQTALTLAAQHGHFAVVQELLARGAAVNAPRADWQTPLHLAAAPLR